MNRKFSFLVTLGLCAFYPGSAQESRDEESPFSETFQTSILGQLEKEKERAHQMLDSVRRASGTGVTFDQNDVSIAYRIKRLERDIPLEYNAKVKDYLDRYKSSNYKPYIEKLLGLSEYYFPIYDEIFSQQGIPKEVRYMSVIESSLDPHTVSRSGAVGPWQFMYGTAKAYDLSIDSYYDERKDVYSATYAVSSYLNEAYGEFDDWLLALASYNCGRGCVRRAIKRSGLHNPNYWQLAPYLPKETQNYIPKYIAMTYILNHAELYGLIPRPHNLQNEHRIVNG
ncbi:MAG: lytic transglycosylase domain-containing protein [Sphingobacterium sp.]